MYVNPGELKKRISIVKLVPSKDKDGFINNENELVGQCWAKATQKSIKEVIESGTEFNLESYRFLIRTIKTPITREMFVLYKGNYYQIEYVNDYNDEGVYTEIMATAGVKNGTV